MSLPKTSTKFLQVNEQMLRRKLDRQNELGPNTGRQDQLLLRLYDVHRYPRYDLSWSNEWRSRA